MSRPFSPVSTSRKTASAVADVELLEARRLLSAAAIHLHCNGTLVVRGTSGDDMITVTLHAAPGGGPAAATMTVEANGNVRLFKGADVTGVRIFGGMGNDHLEIAMSDGVFTVPVTMAGGRGDDTLGGGDGADCLVGGIGSDIVYANAGDGGAGDDFLVGGSGNDIMYGNAGNDHMGGSDGNDFMLGGIGDDVMYGEAGDDALHGGGGDDALSGGENHGYLVGGRGNDQVFDVDGEDVIQGVV
jgi:Ca2+-binding RTX toxin-like protein